MIDNMDAFNSLSQRFYMQYAELRQFYFESANVKYVASIIAVPTLPKASLRSDHLHCSFPPSITHHAPQDPPIFSPAKKKAPQNAPDAQPEPTNMQPQIPANPWANQNPFAFGGIDLESPLSGLQSRPGWYAPSLRVAAAAAHNSFFFFVKPEYWMDGSDELAGSALAPRRWNPLHLQSPHVPSRSTTASTHASVSRRRFSFASIERLVSP